MRRRIFGIIVAVPLALITVASGTAAAFPVARHLASAFWHVPDRLPALAGNSQVHYELGALDFARDVSARLPAAIARIEAAQGRPFAYPAIVGVYATPEAFMTANGSGSMGPVGATLFGRVNLSPVLGGAQHRRLAAILTHELSHAHLEGWMSTSAMIHLPSWFREGLAVMVSDGGGAEFVNEEEARAAIRRGEHIAIEQSGSLFNLFEIPFERAPLGVSASHQTVLAYRQAGMFVSYLRDSDGPGFARMMTAILDGRPFVEAVAAGYTEDIHALWQKFALASAERK